MLDILLWIICIVVALFCLIKAAKTKRINPKLVIAISASIILLGTSIYNTMSAKTKIDVPIQAL